MPRGVYIRKKNKKETHPALRTQIVVDSQESIKFIDFSKLVGLQASLFYSNQLNLFQLGDVLFEVVEDENDGYRSSMKEVKILSQTKERKPSEYLAGIIIEVWDTDPYEGFQITDMSDGHIWLQFGTSYSDSYYPYFCFTFFPKYCTEDQLKDKII